MKRQIIISIGSLQSGGAERVVCEISAMYADYFQEVVILTWIDLPQFYQIDARVRIVCAEKESGFSSRFRQSLWVRKFVKREKPDVFLSFLMPFNMLIIVTLAFTKINVVVCERQDPSKVKTPFLRGVRNFLYHFVSRIEVQTKEGKRYFPSSLQHKIYVIPNPNHITREQRDYCQSCPKDNRIVTVGRLIAAKNHLLLIDAFTEVLAKYPDYRLDIYGEGEMQPVLEEKIISTGVKEHIHLCGRTTDVPSAIASARIFVLSSNVEGMPNSLMEAMALGIPCVATDVSGVRDLITDKENGYVVPVGDRDALINAMLKLIESCELQKLFADSSISVVEKYDKQKIFDKWLEIVTF